MSSAEKPIENAILTYLEYLPDCYSWKNNSIGVYDPVKKTFRSKVNKFDVNGVSDVLGIYKGKFLAIEVKDEKEYKYLMNHYEEIKSGRFTKNVKKKNHLRNQVLFIERMKKQGAIAFFACSVRQVEERLNE